MIKLFTSQKFIIAIITANALLIFLQGFYLPLSSTGILLEKLDELCTLLFLIELIVKLKVYGVKKYFTDAWNIFDFILVLIALPSIIVLIFPINIIALDFLLVFRILRFFKFFRLLKFIPNINKLLKGIYNALQSSILILIAFFIFNFIFAIISFSFFSDILPNYFGNPLIAFYSTFKVFTIEGWYEIPDLIAEKSNSIAFGVFARIYFVILLFGGGIFGLSLINSIFVDSMLMDNNDELTEKIKKLEEKIDLLIKKHD